MIYRGHWTANIANIQNTANTKISWLEWANVWQLIYKGDKFIKLYNHANYTPKHDHDNGWHWNCSLWDCEHRCDAIPISIVFICGNLHQETKQLVKVNGFDRIFEHIIFLKIWKTKLMKQNGNFRSNISHLVQKQKLGLTYPTWIYDRDDNLV